MGRDWLRDDIWRAHVSWLSPRWVGETEEGRRDFDAARWLDQIQSAHYRVLIFYVKHHDGFCAYPSRYLSRPPERDYFGECVREARRRGLLIQAYYSSNLDQVAAEEHPDWRVVGRDGLPQQGWFSAGWPGAYCCINNPGYRGMVLGQLAELRDRYRPDGFWLDVFSPHTDSNCFCPHCRAACREETGEDLEGSTGDAWYRSCFGPFMAEIRDLVRHGNPDCVLGQNTGIRIPAVDLSCDFLTHEAVTSPTISEMCRSLRSVGKPFETTYRLYSAVGSYAMRGYDRVLLESMTTAAHGGACSIELPPTSTGKIMEGAVSCLREVGAYLRAREPYLLGTEPVYDAALFQPVHAYGWPRQPGWHTVFAERDIPYAILYPDAELEPYRLLVLDDALSPDAALAARISAWVRAGGSLIVEGGSACWGTAAGRILEEVLGLSSPGPTGRAAHYLCSVDERVKAGLGEDDLIVEGDAFRIAPTSAEPLAYYRPEFAERSPGRQRIVNLPPARGGTLGPAITANRWGRGRALYLGCPLASGEIRAHRTRWDDLREYPVQLAANLARFLIADPLFEGTTPPGVELVANAQGGRLVVHLLNQYAGGQYADSRRSILSLADVPVSVNEERIGRVTRAFRVGRDGEGELAVCRRGRWAEVRPGRAGVHEMVCFEAEPIG